MKLLSRLKCLSDTGISTEDQKQRSVSPNWSVIDRLLLSCKWKTPVGLSFHKLCRLHLKFATGCSAVAQIIKTLCMGRVRYTCMRGSMFNSHFRYRDGCRPAYRKQLDHRFGCLAGHAGFKCITSRVLIFHGICGKCGNSWPSVTHSFVWSVSCVVITKSVINWYFCLWHHLFDCHCPSNYSLIIVSTFIKE